MLKAFCLLRLGNKITRKVNKLNDRKISRIGRDREKLEKEGRERVVEKRSGIFKDVFLVSMDFFLLSIHVPAKAFLLKKFL